MSRLMPWIWSLVLRQDLHVKHIYHLLILLFYLLLIQLVWRWCCSWLLFFRTGFRERPMVCAQSATVVFVCLGNYSLISSFQTVVPASSYTPESDARTKNGPEQGVRNTITGPCFGDIVFISIKSICNIGGGTAKRICCNNPCGLETNGIKSCSGLRWLGFFIGAACLFVL